MKKQADRINDYFYNAVIVYTFTNEKDAMYAAFTAATVAAAKQRASMASLLERMATDIPAMYKTNVKGDSANDESIRTAEMSHRLIALKNKIEAKDWNLNDIRMAKAALSMINEEYAYALDICDPRVFSRKHPDFSKALIE